MEPISEIIFFFLEVTDVERYSDIRFAITVN